MAITVDSRDKIQEYISGVLGRAGHHAPNVNGVALTLLGAVIWKSDSDIRVREYNGQTANKLWFSVGPNEYFMRYEHLTQLIELHRRNGKVGLIQSFDNNTSYTDIISIFNTL